MRFSVYQYFFKLPNRFESSLFFVGKMLVITLNHGLHSAYFYQRIFLKFAVFHNNKSQYLSENLYCSFPKFVIQLTKIRLPVPKKDLLNSLIISSPSFVNMCIKQNTLQIKRKNTSVIIKYQGCKYFVSLMSPAASRNKRQAVSLRSTDYKSCSYIQDSILPAAN